MQRHTNRKAFAVSEYHVEHNEKDSRFETTVDGENAVLLYRREGDRIIYFSTRVPPAIERRGIGGALARAALDYARENSLTVVPQCPFVRVFIEKNPEYKPLTA